MTWLIVLIIAIIIGAIFGFFTSKDGERGAGAIGGAVAGGIGCGQVLFTIFIYGAIILAFIWLFGKLFG